MSGEASQEEGGHLTFVAFDVAADQHRRGHRCGAQQPQDRHFRGRGVVGVVAVPAQTGPPAQYQTMDPAVAVDYGQRAVQMPAAHW